MAPANEFRGEVRIQFPDETISLKLSLEAIRLLESTTGQSWQKIVAKSLDGDLMLDECISILWAGHYGMENKEILTIEECGEFVEKHGMMNMNLAMRSLMSVQALGQKRSKEIEDADEADRLAAEAKKKKKAPPKE